MSKTKDRSKTAILAWTFETLAEPISFAFTYSFFVQFEPLRNISIQLYSFQLSLAFVFALCTTLTSFFFTSGLATVNESRSYWAKSSTLFFAVMLHFISSLTNFYGLGINSQGPDWYDIQVKNRMKNDKLLSRTLRQVIYEHKSVVASIKKNERDEASGKNMYGRGRKGKFYTYRETLKIFKAHTLLYVEKSRSLLNSGEQIQIEALKPLLNRLSGRVKNNVCSAMLKEAVPRTHASIKERFRQSYNQSIADGLKVEIQRFCKNVPSYKEVQKELQPTKFDLFRLLQGWVAKEFGKISKIFVDSPLFSFLLILFQFEIIWLMFSAIAVDYVPMMTASLVKLENGKSLQLAVIEVFVPGEWVDKHTKVLESIAWSIQLVIMVTFAILLTTNMKEGTTSYQQKLKGLNQVPSGSRLIPESVLKRCKFTLKAKYFARHTNGQSTAPFVCQLPKGIKRETLLSWRSKFFIGGLSARKIISSHGKITFPSNSKGEGFLESWICKLSIRFKKLTCTPRKPPSINDGRNDRRIKSSAPGNLYRVKNSDWSVNAIFAFQVARADVHTFPHETFTLHKAQNLPATVEVYKPRIGHLRVVFRSPELTAGLGPPSKLMFKISLKSKTVTLDLRTIQRVRRASLGHFYAELNLKDDGIIYMSLNKPWHKHEKRILRMLRSRNSRINFLWAKIQAHQKQLKRRHKQAYSSAKSGMLNPELCPPDQLDRTRLKQAILWYHLYGENKRFKRLLRKYIQLLKPIEKRLGLLLSPYPRIHTDQAIIAY